MRYEYEEVRAWIEQEGSIMLKAVTATGDPVELTADEARKISAGLDRLASQLDALDKG